MTLLELDDDEIAVLEKALAIAQEEMEMEEDSPEDLALVTRLLDRLEKL